MIDIEPWQLADDPDTYGENAGKYILVTADREHDDAGQGRRYCD